MSWKKKTLTVSAWVLCILGAACREPPATPARRFDLSGKVVAVDREERRVTVAHQEIPGYMAAMTMPFAVRDEWALSVLAPGQRVHATLVVEASRSWLESISITEGPVDGMPAPDVPAEPKPGDRVPDFVLTNQEGKRIHIGQYRGRALVITFIYTRCPLPDYCPRMSTNLAEIHAAAASDSQLGGRTRLLSVSFDPQFDTPEVLRSYGKIYLGTSRSADFSIWEFATGTPDQVREMAGYFGLSYRRETDQIVHNLRTALIGPDGRLIQLYRGNDWKPQEVLQQLKGLVH